MEKPKSLSEYTLIEQEIVKNKLNELLVNYKDKTYDYYCTYYSWRHKWEAKNIYFYVPELNSFFFMTPDHIVKDLEYRFPRETVNDNLMNYSINNIYSIDDIADCRHHYYESFENKSIVFPEVLELFREKNPYCSIDEYKDKIKFRQNNEAFRNFYGYCGFNFYPNDIEELVYAIVYLKHPQIEKLVKSGLDDIVYKWIHDTNNLQLYSRSFKNGNNINEITKLPKFAWQLLKDEGMSRDITKWNEFRVWVQKDNLSKDQLETIINLKIRDTQVIKSIRSILNSEYNGKKLYTLDTLLNYLSRVDMYQAIRSNDAITILRDYIRMALDCGIEPVTNSNSLKREHDVTMRNYQILLQAKKEEYQASLGKPFKERSKELEKYEFRDEYLQAIVPKDMEDLLQEGRNNNNCVGGYIERFAKGTSNIFFIRKNDNPERSYITIELNNDFSDYRQAYYSSNRDITDPKDMNFIKKWIEKTKEIYNQKTLSLDKDITEDMF